MKKTISVFIILSLLLCCMAGCLAWDPVLRYAGEHSELMATAIYSIPGVESSVDDSLIVLETDPYGRVLFAVCLARSFLLIDSWNNCTAAILIMQKYDDNYVYFYPEQNYHVTILEKHTDLTKNTVSNLFTDELISNLKEANSWNLPPSEEDALLICMPKTCEKSNKVANTSTEILKQYVGSNIRYSFFREDSGSNSICFVLHVTAPSSYEWYIAAFQQDGTLCIGKNSILKLDKSNPDSIPLSVRDLLSYIS